MDSFDSTGKFLTPELYWKWRLYAEFILHAKTKQKLSELSMLQMEKDLQILKLKHDLYKLTQHKEAGDAVKEMENGYQDVRTEIEKLIEMPLKDCMIDEFTYEVKTISKV